MITKQVTINRNLLWLSYEEILEENVDNLLEPQGFICYFNRERSQLILGESIKDNEGNVRRFKSIEEAESISEVIIERKIYPPNFFNPKYYEMHNIAEIMHKPIRIEIGETPDQIDKIVEGNIIECTPTPNNQYLLAYVLLESPNGETQSFSIFELQKFIKP